MDNLIFITAHCPSVEQEIALEKCIDSVSKVGYHIALISHTHIPFNIQKKCNYYFYDHLNEVSDDFRLLPPGLTYKFGNTTIKSLFFIKNFYGFAIYRMFSIASQIAINFGYKKLHHIEYDGLILNDDILRIHSELLNEWESVVYTSDGTSDGDLFGSFKSIRVNKIPPLISNYNKEKIEMRMKENGENLNLEDLTKKVLDYNTKVHYSKKSDLQPYFKKGDNFYERGNHFTLYHSKEDDTAKFFYHSMIEETENIMIILNDNKVYEFLSKPKNWNVLTLCKMDELKKIRVDNSKKILYQQVFTKDSREVLKKHSYEIIQKNN